METATHLHSQVKVKSGPGELVVNWDMVLRQTELIFLNK